MVLSESTQDEVIASFKNVMRNYDALRDACSEFQDICSAEKDLDFESSYLYDFVREELSDKIKSTQDEILDVYFPIDYADDEEDAYKAGDRYRDSKEARERVFATLD